MVSRIHEPNFLTKQTKIIIDSYTRTYQNIWNGNDINEPELWGDFFNCAPRTRESSRGC